MEEKETKKTTKTTKKKTKKVETPVEEVVTETSTVETPVAAPVEETQPVEQVSAPVEQVSAPVEQVSVEQPTSIPSFEMPSNASKKPFNKAFILIGVAVVAAIALIGILIANNNGKTIIKNTIKANYKELVKAVKETEDQVEKFDINKNAVYFNGDVKIKSEVDGENFDGSFEWNAGVSVKDSKAYGMLKAKGEEENVSIEGLIEDGKVFAKTSLINDVLDLSDYVDEDEINEVFDTFKNSKDIKASEALEIGEYVIDALIDNIDEDDIEKDTDEIELGGKDIKVNKITYDLSGKALGKLLKGTVSDLSENDKFIEKLTDYAKNFSDDISKKDIKNALKELKEEASDIEIDEKIKINIYTKGLLNKVVGYSIEIDKEEVLTVYFDDKNVEIVLNTGDEDYGTKYSIVAEKDGKEWNVKVKEDKETIAEATIREFSNEKIDMDYEINIDDEETVSGSIYFTEKVKNDNISGEFEFKITYEENNIEVSGNYNVETKKEIEESIATKDAIDPEDIDVDELEKEINKVKKDEVINALLGEMLDDFLDSISDYDYYDMKRIYTNSEVEKVLSKDKAVLLVGRQYYYYDDDASNIVENLKKLQDKLGFHSYFYSATYSNDIEALEEYESVCGVSYVKDELIIYDTEEKEVDENDKKETDETKVDETDKKEQVEIIQEPIETDDCSKLPTVYLIKNGKVAVVIRGKVTADEMKEALASIGIK